MQISPTSRATIEGRIPATRINTEVKTAVTNTDLTTFSWLSRERSFTSLVIVLLNSLLFGLRLILFMA